jgi:hypothetical protein
VTSVIYDPILQLLTHAPECSDGGGYEDEDEFVSEAAWIARVGHVAEDAQELLEVSVWLDVFGGT